MQKTNWLGGLGYYYTSFYDGCYYYIESDYSGSLYTVWSPGKGTLAIKLTRDDAFDLVEAKIKEFAEMHKECS